MERSLSIVSRTSQSPRTMAMTWNVFASCFSPIASRSLIAQVTAIATSNATGINISPVAATGLASVPIGQANLYGSGLLPPAANFGPSAPAANAHALGGAIEAGVAFKAPLRAIAENHNLPVQAMLGALVVMAQEHALAGAEGSPRGGA